MIQDQGGSIEGMEALEKKFNECVAPWSGPGLR